jgi:transposase
LLRQLNQRIEDGQAKLLSAIEVNSLAHQIILMCTVPGISILLALRVIAEMGANFHQRNPSVESFSKAIGVVPSNEVSGGKLLKRRASYGNKRLKFHFLSVAKSYDIDGEGHLHDWYTAYRGRTNCMKATAALS